MPYTGDVNAAKTYFALQPDRQFWVLSEEPTETREKGKALKILKEIRSQLDNPLLVVYGRGGVEGVVNEIVSRYEGKLGFCDKIWLRFQELRRVETVRTLAHDILRQEEVLPQYIPACRAIWQDLYVEEEKVPGRMKAHIKALKEGEASEEKDATLKAVIAGLEERHAEKAAQLVFSRFHNPDTAWQCQHQVARWLFGGPGITRQQMGHREKQLKAMRTIRIGAVDSNVAAAVDCLKRGEIYPGRDHHLQITIVRLCKRKDLKTAVELLRLPFYAEATFADCKRWVVLLAQELGQEELLCEMTLPAKRPVYTPDCFIPALTRRGECGSAISLAQELADETTRAQQIEVLQIGKLAAKSKLDEMVDELIALKKEARGRALACVLSVLNYPDYMRGRSEPLRLIEALTLRRAYDAATKVADYMLKRGGARVMKLWIEDGRENKTSAYGERCYAAG